MLSHSLYWNFRQKSFLAPPKYMSISRKWDQCLSMRKVKNYKEKGNIQSFQLVSIYFLLAIHNTAIWNVTFDQGKSEAISSALSLTSGLLQYSAWISASGPWIEWFLFLGMMVYASILEKQKRTWYHAGPYGAPEHNFLCPSFLWLQETAFIQPLWPPLSSSGQIHAVVN